MAFRCKYKLDQRPSPSLVRAYEEIYRLVETLALSIEQVRVNRRGRPDPVQLWVLYVAGLTYGAAQAALVLILHNLQREALAFQRIVVEVVGRAFYYRNHPRAARLEIDAESFRELELLKKLKYDKRRTRYRRVKRVWETLRRNSAIERYVKKRQTFKRMMWRRKGRRQNFVYAFFYEVYSRLSHASVLGMRDVVQIDKGLRVNFDSRLGNPDLTLDITAHYVLVFLELLDEVFQLKRASDLASVRGRLTAAHNELLARMRSRAVGK